MTGCCCLWGSSYSQSSSQTKPSQGSGSKYITIPRVVTSHINNWYTANWPSFADKLFGLCWRQPWTAVAEICTACFFLSCAGSVSNPSFNTHAARCRISLIQRIMFWLVSIQYEFCFWPASCSATLLETVTRYNCSVMIACGLCILKLASCRCSKGVLSSYGHLAVCSWFCYLEFLFRFCGCIQHFDR